MIKSIFGEGKTSLLEKSPQEKNDSNPNIFIYFFFSKLKLKLEEHNIISKFKDVEPSFKILEIYRTILACLNLQSEPSIRDLQTFNEEKPRFKQEASLQTKICNALLDNKNNISTQ